MEFITKHDSVLIVGEWYGGGIKKRRRTTVRNVADLTYPIVG